MKKQLTIALIATAAGLCYFILRNKYKKVSNEVEPNADEPNKIKSVKHHLTNAFSNAKKHLLVNRN